MAVHAAQQLSHLSSHRRAHGQAPSANSSQHQPGKEPSVHGPRVISLNKILPH